MSIIGLEMLRFLLLHLIVVSKMGVSALSRIQQRQLDQDSSRSNIVVNHVHPGNYVKD